MAQASATAAAVPAHHAYARPACIRHPRVHAAAGNRFGVAVADSLRWLNWDQARAYGSGKGPEGFDSPAARSSGTWPSGSSGASLDSADGAPPSSPSSSSTRGSDVTSVSLKDPAKLERIRHAFDNGSLAFGFSAGGLMFPYYVGVCSVLEEMGVLKRPHQLAGASAGSLIAAAYNTGLDMRVVEESMILFGEDCLQNGTQHRLGPLLRDFLHAYLPPDAHERCSGNTHVAITRALPYWRSKLVSHFESRDDLVAALMTSCHIPWYFDGRWMTKFRGHYAVDGGATNFIPVVPGADYTVKVMCFPTVHLEAIRSRAARLALVERFLDIDISLDSFEEWGHGYPTVLKWALQASPRETSSYLIEKGKRDARSWVVATGLGDILAERAAAEARADGAAGGARAGQELVLPQGWRQAADGLAAAAAAAGAVTAQQQQQQQQPQQQPSQVAAARLETPKVKQESEVKGDAQQPAAGEEHRGHKRRREEEGGERGEPGVVVPGLTGQPRTDTAPLADKPPA